MRATPTLKHLLCGLTIWGLLSGTAVSVLSQETNHGDHSDHFSHPLIAESPSPDTKIRLDYSYASLSGDDQNEHVVRFESELAFGPRFSVEVSLPYVFLKTAIGSVRNFDSMEIAFKYAHTRAGENTLLLGGGLSFTVPTGEDSKNIGSGHIVDLEPFVHLAYKTGELELVGFMNFGLPLNKQGDNEADLEWSWNGSGLYHLNTRIEMLLEFDGVHIFGGNRAGLDAIAITPAVKVAPLRNRNFQLGLGLRLPIDKEEEDATAVISSFYHF